MTLYADADGFAMGDDRLPTLIPEALDSPSGAVQITLQDYFPIYRAANPVPGETVKGTFVGHSEGRIRRMMQKLFVFIAVGMPVMMLLRAQRNGPSPRVSAAIGIALGVLAVQLMWFVIRRIQGPPPDGLRAVMITDKRVVLFEHAKHREPRVTALLPAGSVNGGRVEKVEDVWVTGGLTRLILGGVPGPLITLDLPRVNPRSAQLVLEEAGSTVFQTATANAPAEQRIAGWRPSWMLRAFGISIGLLFGAFAVVAVIGSIIKGQIVPLVVSLVFAVVLLGGTAFLFKSRKR